LESPSHRRGAENAEASQRKEEEERREGVEKLSLFLSSSSLRGLSVLCGASAVERSLSSLTYA
jgi:hypothetical protein